MYSVNRRLIRCQCQKVKCRSHELPIRANLSSKQKGRNDKCSHVSRIQSSAGGHRVTGRPRSHKLPHCRLDRLDQSGGHPEETSRHLRQPLHCTNCQVVQLFLFTKSSLSFRCFPAQLLGRLLEGDGPKNGGNEQQNRKNGERPFSRRIQAQLRA